MRIILASQSPFRTHALDVLGLHYETMPSNFDEKTIREEKPLVLARLLSEAKAREIGKTETNALIIAADLLVVHNNKIFEKPQDKKEAFEMLNTLSGNRFEIITGLAVYSPKNGKIVSGSQTCTVKFRNLLEEEIMDYMERYPVLKCAGAFEGDGLLRFAENINGQYNFRTAMSVNELVLFLREHGLKI